MTFCEFQIINRMKLPLTCRIHIRSAKIGTYRGPNGAIYFNMSASGAA